uniref:uncharacterized protein LOC120337964 n=1 Tax=Styela clava TaxID=7725 RepID=UPI0019393590|nr:uncharacterized protein LOC120337964 [Styela clava]
MLIWKYFLNMWSVKNRLKTKIPLARRKPEIKSLMKDTSVPYAMQSREPQNTSKRMITETNYVDNKISDSLIRIVRRASTSWQQNFKFSSEGTGRDNKRFRPRTLICKYSLKMWSMRNRLKNQISLARRKPEIRRLMEDVSLAVCVDGFATFGRVMKEAFDLSLETLVMFHFHFEYLNTCSFFWFSR